MDQRQAACGIISQMMTGHEITELRENRGQSKGLTLTPFIVLILSALLLHGCGTSAVSRDSATEPSADAAYTNGAYERAARTWQLEAMEAPAGEAGAIWVSAADAWILAGKPGEAEKALGWVDRNELSTQDRARMDLVLADLALWSRRTDEAEALLQKAADRIPSSSRSRYDGLYTRLIQMLSSPATQEIAQAARLGEGMRYYDPAAAVEMMKVLESVSTGELAIRAYNPRGERQLAGWLDLALEIRQHLVNPEGVAGAMSAWKSRNPYHVLEQNEALDTWLRYRQTFSAPRRVAVILPASGRLQNAGEAIRDGLLSAYADQPGGSELVFFPTGDDPQSPISAYFSALDAGADWIIGPLRREDVDAMLNLAGMSTPVLALNDLPEAFVAPPGLENQVRGLSLSQDEEVRAIARHAAASGFERAILLAPESAWGERMAAGFQDEFLQDDQQIVAALRYLESQNDHGSTLQRALKIDESKARKQRLQNTLQTTLEFEPVRRTDVDVIFMAANTTQARLIRPQLRFHDAGNIPVYATRRVYSGQPDTVRNRDLDGVRFPGTRWQLDHPGNDDLPDIDSLRGGNLSALFALGQDAWNLLPWLDLMSRDPGFRFPGQSGDYYDRRHGTLLREPNWAMFRNGRPAPLATEADRGEK